jgi:ceramide glucosyltransferase
MLNWILGVLAVLSFVLLLWQWAVARRFPLHQRVSDESFAPAVTLLKPLKGCDSATENCLRSWLAQDYAGDIQILFGVASAADPVCGMVRKLMQEHPNSKAQLVVCSSLAGANAKVFKLAELEKKVEHDTLVVSDADVRVPPDFLTNAVAPLRVHEVSLASCFYRLANPASLAMQWEAIAINADFWSQVLQSRSLKLLDFALGAAMVARRKHVAEIGGFSALADCLADDYQLGNRIARKGHRLALCPVVVECWDPPMGWGAVWQHQLRWARTIRVCQPVPYFFSILSNATLWPVLWFAVAAFGASFSASGFGSSGFAVSVALPSGLAVAAICILVRMFVAFDLQRRLTQSSAHGGYFWLVPIKDLLQAAIWLCAFAGNRVEWRGQRFRLRRDGTLVKR